MPVFGIMWTLRVLYIIFLVCLLWTYTSPRPHSDKESMADAVIRIKDVKCPNCYPSTFDGTVCASDGKTYQNMAIFMCVNKCKKGMKVVTMERCPDYDAIEDPKPTPVPKWW